MQVQHWKSLRRTPEQAFVVVQRESEVQALQYQQSSHDADDVLEKANNQMQSKISTDAYRVAADGDIYDIDEEDVDTTGDSVCKLGSFERDNLCIPCEAGRYQEENYCLPCAGGTYQPEEGKTFCLQCPDGKTSEPGAVSEEDCV